MTKFLRTTNTAVLALLFTFVSTPRAESPAPLISPSEAELWHATLQINKPKGSAEKAWNKAKAKLPVAGTLTDKTVQLNIGPREMEGYPISIMGSHCFDNNYGGIACEGSWSDVERGESGIFYQSYDKQKNAHVIEMGTGINPHDSYKDYTLTLKRGK